MNEELKNDNTQVVQPVLPIPTTNIDWITVANNKIDKSIQEQPHSEVVRHPKIIDKNTWTLKAPNWNDKNIYTTFIPVGYFLSTNQSNR